MSQLTEQICAHVLEASMNALWKSTEKYIQHNVVGPEDEMMERMLNIMAAYCMIDMRSKASAESLAEAKLVEASDKTFQEVFDEIMNEKAKLLPFAKTHPKYKLYKKKVALLTTKVVDQVETNEDADEELVVTQAEVNTIDPISRQPMKSPVKNKKCGHSYDKNSIIALFGKKKELKCPYVGCPFRDNFTLEDLEEDFELKQHIIRQQQMQSN